MGATRRNKQRSELKLYVGLFRFNRLEMSIIAKERSNQ